MALNRLPPPNVAGTIPSFYSTDLGTSLEVPFSMNTMVNKTAVGGFQLRLKTTSTDIVLVNMESDNYTLNTEQMSVTFNLESIRSTLVIGNFYKVQIAYVDKENGVIGYYSTVAIVKYTSKPNIEIAGLNKQSLTSISSQRFIGTYSNIDSSEKVYQYRFILYNSLGNEIENSGWLLHNVQADDAIDNSNDVHQFHYNLLEDLQYYVQYQVRTNNGLSLTTVKYKVALSLYTSAGLSLKLSASLDYENARVKVEVAPLTVKYDPDTEEEIPTLLQGTYIISRTSSKDNFVFSETLQNNSMMMSLTSTNTYSFYDYAVESGVEYRYYIQRYNNQNIFSQKVQSNLISVFFEDIFLYDGEKQLRIRFNPQVSSFKAVVADSKKTTLGSQYPFIFRNGILNYKEFPISGLISYQLDNDELFLSRSEWKTVITNYGSNDITIKKFEMETDLTDTNFKYEKIFKLYVLDWLNDGNIKLFKSPQEGNYIVRLTNVSLTPNQTVSRLLHTFSCTASEVAEYSLANLAEYSLVNSVEENVTHETVKIINIRDIYRKFYNEDTSPDKSQYLQAFSQYDFTEQQPCRKIRFMHQLSSDYLDQRDAVYGMIFEWGEQNFAIDRSGFAEIELDYYMTAPLRLLNPQMDEKNTGYLELTIEQSTDDALDSIYGTTTLPIFGYTLYGTKEEMEDVKDDSGKIIGQYSRNLFAEFNNNKSVVSSIQLIKYSLAPLYKIGIGKTVEAEWADIRSELKLDVDPEYLFTNCCYIYREQRGKKEYWKWDGTQLVPISNYGTKILFGDVEQDITVLQDKQVNFITSIPKKKDGTVSLRVQPGVIAQVYGTQQVISYLIEQYDFYEISKKELEAYENYCMKLFNYKIIPKYDLSRLTVAQKKSLYIFQDRTFVKIDSTQAESYADTKTIYAPAWPTIYSDSEIQAAWEAYLSAKKILDDQLDAYLKAQG